MYRVTEYNAFSSSPVNQLSKTKYPISAPKLTLDTYDGTTFLGSKSAVKEECFPRHNAWLGETNCIPCPVQPFISRPTAMEGKAITLSANDLEIASDPVQNVR